MIPVQATTVYVYLPDEAVDVWRPVSAEHIREEVYRIVGEAPDPEDEKWEFLPGQLVRCRMQQLFEGEFLVAYESASPMATPITPPSQALQQADATLRSLLQSVLAAICATPLDLASVRTLLMALFEYLSSPGGRTDANCRAVDVFFYLDDDLPLDRLPDSLQDVFAHLDALHDTISAPEIAKNFGSTPEQLLERVRKADI